MMCSISSECNGIQDRHRQCDFLGGHNHPAHTSPSSDSWRSARTGSTVKTLLPLPVLVWRLFPVCPRQWCSARLTMQWCPFHMDASAFRNHCLVHLENYVYRAEMFDLSFSDFLIFLRHISCDTLRKFKITRNFSLKFVNIYFRKV